MQILAHALSNVIYLTQIILGFSMSLPRRFTKPSERFGIVLAHALSVGIHNTQVILGVGKPLHCRLAIPFDRFGIVLAYASSVFIHHTQIILGIGNPLLSQLQGLPEIQCVIRPNCLIQTQSQQCGCQ